MMEIRRNIWKRRLRFQLLTLLILAGAAMRLHAQQDPHYSQYLFNGLVINPAYAGSRGTITSQLYFRKQWWGFEGSPLTQSLSFHLPTPNKRYGFGLSMTNDRSGYLSQQWFNLSYAFRIPLGPGNLALGLQGGLLNYRINWDKATTIDGGDMTIPLVSQNFVLPNAGTGIWYNTEYFFAGFSVPHLFNSALHKGVSNQDFARLYRHYFLTAGYVFGRLSAIKVKPSFLLKYAEGSPLQADINLSVLFRDRLWVGTSWRTSDAMVLMSEFYIQPGFKIGYAFDFTLTGLRKFSSGSHELMISYEVLYKKAKLKSPRHF